MKQSKLLSLLAGLFIATTSLWADPAVAINGKLPGAFSVSATKVVYFSQGNLQYKASTGTWRFAEHQYDYVGNATRGNVYENSVKCDNSLISSTYTGWIDLFGWATSGWDNNGKRNAYQPYATNTSSNDYYTTTSAKQGYNESLTGAESSQADWGVYNADQLGEDWRTLTVAEWVYLMGQRHTSTQINGTVNARWALATILTDGSGTESNTYNIRGAILFPDNFDGSVNYPGVTWGAIETTTNFNTYCTIEGWAALENAGCVFLPATSKRRVGGGISGSKYVDPDFMDVGYYWSANAQSIGNAYSMTNQGVTVTFSRNTGIGVRLVSNKPYGYDDAVVTTAPAAVNRSYDASTQALITAGTATGGTMKYSLTSGSGYSTDLPTAKNAGTYTVYYMVEGDATHNDVAEASVEVTVSKVGLTVTADNKAVTCGEAAPAYTATYNGFVGGETEAVLGGTLAFACGYTTTSAAGDYTITPSGLTSDNYTITFQTGTLTASKADAEVTTPPAAVNRSYDASTQALITAGTATGGTMKYSLTSGSGYSTDLPTAKNAGTYTVYYMVEGDATHNDVAEASLEVTVSKVGLTITAENKAVTCGEAAPAYTASYNGFVGGETEAVLGGTLAFACDYTTTSAAGDYTITPSGLTSDNYTITFQTGTLTATAAAPVVVTIDVPTHQDPLNSQWYYTTFYHSTQNYALTNDATEAFVADLSGTDLVLTKIAEGEQVIPAHTGVIFRKSYSADPVVLAPTDALGVSFTANNDLEGVDVQTDLTAIDGLTAANCYILSGQADDHSVVGVGFYKVNKSYLKEHKAYVKYVGNPSNAPKRMRFVFEQENTATGMESILIPDGERLFQPSDVSCQKVLRDGQLIIIRNGVEYNANGQIVK